MESRAQHLRQSLTDAIETESPGLLEACPPARYLRSLEQDERPGFYQYLPPEQTRWCEEIREKGGNKLLETYQQLLLAILADESEDRLARSGLPESVQELMRRYMEMAVDQLEKPRAGFYRPDNDSFIKQLCVGRHRLISCGPELVDPLSGVPKSVFLFGSFAQRLRAAVFLTFRTRGLQPFYTLHTDRHMAGKLNEKDYGECYERVAELLRANPEMKGLMGKSWFNDPALEVVSPELAFMGRDPYEGGALRLREGTTPDALKSALRFAPRRKELYDAGEYEPTEYWLIWHRDDLLRWVDRRRG